MRLAGSDYSCHDCTRLDRLVLQEVSKIRAERAVSFFLRPVVGTLEFRSGTEGKRPTPARHDKAL